MFVEAIFLFPSSSTYHVASVLCLVVIFPAFCASPDMSHHRADELVQQPDEEINQTQHPTSILASVCVCVSDTGDDL